MLDMNTPEPFAKLRRVGEVLKNLKPAISSEVQSKVAILFDWNNQFSIPEAMGLRNKQFKEKFDSYREATIPYHRALRACGVEVDIIDPDNLAGIDINQYQLIVAPLTYMISEEAAANLNEYVKNGGNLAATYWCGQVNTTTTVISAGSLARG